MRGSTSRWIAAVVALGGAATLAGCSLLYDGDRFRGGEAVDDAGSSDGSVAPDGDASDECGGCNSQGSECIEGTCVDCDEDDDGYYGDDPRCADRAPGAIDCNDADASIHPGALPICGDGIDQGCLGETRPFFGPADELGAYATREIVLPTASAERPRTVRVFVVGAGRVQVLFQNGDTHRTPYMIDHTLSTTEGEPLTGAMSLELLLGEFNGTVRTDAFRDNDGVLRAGVVSGDSGQLDGVALTRPFGAEVWTIGERVRLQTTQLGAPTFQAQGRAALARVGSSTSITLIGVESADNQPTLLAFPLDGGAPGGRVTRAFDPGPRWITTAGDGVIVPTTDGLLRFWGGRRDINDTSVVMSANALATPVASSVAAMTVRSSSDAGGDLDNQIVALHPDATAVRAFALQCAEPSSLATCGAWTVVPAPPPYPLELSSPIVALARVSRSAALLMLPGKELTDPLRLAIMETDGGLPTELSPVHAATVGAGVFRELAMDAWFVPEEGHDSRGQMTLTYAYLREDETAGRRLYVSGYRACAGYGSR